MGLFTMFENSPLANTMAGEGEDSWKSIFEQDGFKVECVLRGLGENAEIRRLFVRHAAAAITE